MDFSLCCSIRLALEKPNRNFSFFFLIFYFKNNPRKEKRKTKKEEIKVQTKKNPRTKFSDYFCLVRVVGLEPTLFRTRPLNVRVCHSATLASMYIIEHIKAIVKCFLQISRKNFISIFHLSRAYIIRRGEL